MYDLNTNYCFISKDVLFYETIFPSHKVSLVPKLNSFDVPNLMLPDVPNISVLPEVADIHMPIPYYFTFSYH